MQAVVREVLEETGIAAEVVPHAPLHEFRNVPQLPAPLAIIDAHQMKPRVGVDRLGCSRVDT